MLQKGKPDRRKFDCPWKIQLALVRIRGVPLFCGHFLHLRKTPSNHFVFPGWDRNEWHLWLMEEYFFPVYNNGYLNRTRSYLQLTVGDVGQIWQFQVFQWLHHKERQPGRRLLNLEIHRPNLCQFLLEPALELVRDCLRQSSNYILKWTDKGVVWSGGSWFRGKIPEGGISCWKPVLTPSNKDWNSEVSASPIIQLKDCRSFKCMGWCSRIDQSTGWPWSWRKSSKTFRNGWISSSLKGASGEPNWQAAMSFLSNLLVIIICSHCCRKCLKESGIALSDLLQSGSEFKPPPSSTLYGKASMALIGMIADLESQLMSPWSLEKRGNTRSAKAEANWSG